MNKKEIIEDIRDILAAYDEEEVFNELRAWVEDSITDKKLKQALILLIDQSEADYEDNDMVLAVLETEIECYFSNIETRSK